MRETGDGEFSHIGLAQHDRASVSQIGDYSGVIVGDEVRENSGTSRASYSLALELIFHRHWHSMHRSPVFT